MNWLNQFNTFAFTHNGGYAYPDGFRQFIAAGATSVIFPKSFTEARMFLQKEPRDWWFGHFNFEFNQVIHSNKKELTGFPPALLFKPQHLLEISGDTLIVHASSMNAETLMASILETPEIQTEIHPILYGKIQPLMDKEAYLNALDKVLYHIQRGDCYELNYCQAFSTEASLSPAVIFSELLQHAPNPFAVMYRFQSLYCLCASPERYLRKEGPVIYSQPIKGTSPRGNDTERDRAYYEELLLSEKDRSENVMVVDLVRNDFNSVCVAGSVQAKALFEVKSYPGVHQMVSTIEGTLQAERDLFDALEATFPMGSMTGAPKHRVLELTREFEMQQRGLYSGTIGYITPEGDADFNVVIRSMFYNSDTDKLCFMAGGGITNQSVPEKEYDESVLKTNAIQKMLRQ